MNTFTPRHCLPALLLVAATAHAQTAPPPPRVVVFGTVNAQLESISTSDSANPALDKPSRWRVSGVSSDLGVRASLPLNATMTGLAQYVTGVSVDNAGGNANGGLWANAKDAFVGLRIQDVGTVKLGRMTAAARWNSGTADFSPSGAGPQDNQAPLSGVSGQTGASPLFNVRLDNAIGFESASFAGFSARAYFGANEAKSNATVSSGAKLDDKSYSLGLQWVGGPVDLRASYEVRNDKGTLNNSTTNDTQDKDLRLGVRVKLGENTLLALGLDRMSFSDATATGTAKSSLKKSGWTLGARHQMGQHVVYGGFGKAGNVTCTLANGAVCDGSNTGMKQLVAAYNYVFNAEMLFETFVSQVTNQARARYDFDSGSVGTAVGAKATAFGLGLRYAF